MRTRRADGPFSDQPQLGREGGSAAGFLFVDPRGKLRTRGEAEFDEGVLDVTFDGALGNYKPVGNCPVTQSFGDQFSHLLLASGEAEGLATRRGHLGPRSSPKA